MVVFTGYYSRFCAYIPSKDSLTVLPSMRIMGTELHIETSSRRSRAARHLLESGGHRLQALQVPLA